MNKPSVLKRFGQSLHKRMHSPSPKGCPTAASPRPASAHASNIAACVAAQSAGAAGPSGATPAFSQTPALPLPLPGLGLCGAMGVRDEEEEEESEGRAEPVVKSTTVKLKTLNPVWNEAFQLCVASL